MCWVIFAQESSNAIHTNLGRVCLILYSVFYAHIKSVQEHCVELRLLLYSWYACRTFTCLIWCIVHDKEKGNFSHMPYMAWKLISFFFENIYEKYQLFFFFFSVFFLRQDIKVCVWGNWWRISPLRCWHCFPRLWILFKVPGLQKVLHNNTGQYLHLLVTNV